MQAILVKIVALLALGQLCVGLLSVEIVGKKLALAKKKIKKNTIIFIKIIEIWDDYDDTLKQNTETFMYVSSENFGYMKSYVFLEYLISYIKEKILIKDVKFRMNYNRMFCKIQVTNLSHKKRITLLQKLREAKIKYGDLAFYFISES